MSLDPFALQEPFSQIAAREHFTNREGFIEVFRRYANADIPTPLKVVMFHGVGGIGKTTLLNKLMSDLEAEGARDTDPTTPVPYARFNMEDVRETGQAYRQALLKLRSDLGASVGVGFPRFDVCLSVILAQEGGDAPPLIRSNPLLYRTFEFAVGMSGLSIPFGLLGAAAAKLMDKQPALEELVRKAGGTEEVLKLRQRARQSDPTLPDELIKRFAQDLADGLPARDGKACRAVLFFDTFETLWTGGGRAQDSSALARSLDDWVQTLAQFCLHERVGALIVIGGRDRLQWGDETDRWKPLLDQHLMGGVSAPDAQIFLNKCAVGLAPPHPASPLQQAILRACDTRYDTHSEMSCHPFYLALCAEIVLNTRRETGGAEPKPEAFVGIPSHDAARDLSNRFLKSLNNADMEHWITELSLTPRFDEQAALALDDDRFHQNGRSAWERLTQFSFLEPQGDGFYRMNKIMRDVLRSAFPAKDARAVHEWFEAHWGERGEATLQFYHRWVQNPATVREEWKAEHGQALKDTQPEAARRLLRLWAEVGLDDFDRKVLGDEEWARHQSALGFARYRTPVANRQAAITEAILRYRECLDVWDESSHPHEWSTTQHQLGVAYRNLPGGDRGANIAMAIACYEAALRVRTEQATPEEWAGTLNNLGYAYSQLPTGDRNANLAKTIACYEDALRVRTEEADPYEWAGTQNNLGLAYGELPGGDRSVNLANSIACFNQSLKVYTEQAYPQEWARTQNNLGLAYTALPRGDRGDNLKRAIACFNNALTVRTEQAYPHEWATTQGNLGVAYAELGEADGDDALIVTAIECFDNASKVHSEEDYPFWWAMTQRSLAVAYGGRLAGDRSANLVESRARYENAFKFWNEREYPFEWAETQNALGLTLSAHGKAAEAVARFQNAARAYRAVGSEAKAREADAAAARLESGDKGT